MVISIYPANHDPLVHNFIVFFYISYNGNDIEVNGTLTSSFSFQIIFMISKILHLDHLSNVSYMRVYVCSVLNF